MVLKAISTKPLFPWLCALFVGSVILIENRWFGHAHFRSITGGAMIDMNLINTSTDILRFMDRVGGAGRASYRLLLFLDYILIAMLFLFSAAMLYRLLNAGDLWPQNSWLVLLPLGRGLFDSIETGALLITVLTYPNISLLPVWLAVVSTPAKWLLFFGNIAVVVPLIALAGTRKLLRPGRI